MQCSNLEIPHTAGSGVAHQVRRNVDQVISQPLEPASRQRIGHRQPLKQRMQIVSQNSHAPPSRVRAKLRGRQTSTGQIALQDTVDRLAATATIVIPLNNPLQRPVTVPYVRYDRMRQTVRTLRVSAA